MRWVLWSGVCPLTMIHLVVVQSLNHFWLFATPWTATCQASLYPAISQSLLKESSPLSQWCHPNISSSVIPFSSYVQSFPAGSFPMSWLFSSGGQIIGASVSASVFPINIQGWFPLGWTGLISLQSKGLSRVFSSTTVQKHQFLGIQPFLLSSSQIHTQLLERTYLCLDGPL